MLGLKGVYYCLVLVTGKLRAKWLQSYVANKDGTETWNPEAKSLAPSAGCSLTTPPALPTFRISSSWLDLCPHLPAYSLNTQILPTSGDHCPTQPPDPNSLTPACLAASSQAPGVGEKAACGEVMDPRHSPHCSVSSPWALPDSSHLHPTVIYDPHYLYLLIQSRCAT